MRYRVFIDGVERSDYCDPASFHIVDELNKQANTASFDLIDDTGALTFPERAEVVITDSTGLAGTKYFGGYAVIKDLGTFGALRKRWTAACVGWENLFDGVLVAKSYTSKRTDEIVADLFSIASFDLSAFTATGLTAGRSIDRIRFVYISLRECLDRLAAIDGYVWWVDPDKRVHYEPVGGSAAPFAISDTPDMASSFPCAQLAYKEDSSQPATRVFVQGGYILSGDQSLEFPGTGQQTVFAVGYRFHANTGESAIIVEKNTNTDVSPVWTAQSIGIENIDQLTSDGGTKDVLYDFQGRVFRFDSAPAALERGWRVRAQFEKRLLVQVIDAAALARYGRHFDAKIEDTTLTQQSLAIARAQVLLAERNDAKTYGSFRCDEPGLQAGQRIGVTNAARGISGTFVIRRVEHAVHPEGGQIGIYRVDFGDFSPRLDHWMLEVNRLLQPQVQSEEDETLNVFLSYIVPNVGVSALTWSKTAVTPGSLTYDGARYGYGTYS